MKLYMDPGSGSCRRVLTVAQHLNIELEEVFIDLLTRQNRNPDFLAINPNGMVPTLRDGDTVLWESSAIMIYLAEKIGDTTLWPSGPERYDVLRWMFWAADHFRQGPPIYLDERVFMPMAGMPTDETRIAEADRRMKQFAPVLDAHLQKRDYVVGNRFTFADIDLAAALSQMGRARIPFEPYPNIMRWSRHLHEAIPAWRETGARLDERMDAAMAAAGLIPPQSKEVSQ